MTHYICDGICRGVSETPGVCQMKDCPNYGKPLTECNCAGGPEAHRKPPQQSPAPQ